MSITEIVIFSGVATGITMIAVTPWTELLEMIWGATAGIINSGGSAVRNKLEESGPFGYFLSKAGGFIPGFALTRLAVSQEARDKVRACSKIEVKSATSFFDRLGCGSKSFFWG